MISDKNKLSAAERAFKTCHEFLRPVLKIAALLSGILCCFPAAEGSNTRLVSLCVLIGCVAFLAGAKWFDRSRQKRDVYKMYRAGIVRKLEPGVLIPLCFITLLVVIPFYIMLITSFKTPGEANDIVFSWIPKRGLTLDAYKEVFVTGNVIGLNMGRAVRNSLVYTLVPLTVGLSAATLAAYAYAKLRFRAQKGMYQILIATMMMPGCVTMATSYMMFDWYGWTNSPLPLIVPGCFSGIGTIMFLREFMMGIPDALLESAHMDGAGKWKSFRYIILPMMRPAITAQFVLGFIGGFNDFMGPLIYLNDPDGYTVQVALGFINEVVTDKSVLAASCMVGMVPMLLLYILFQKQIVDSMFMSSGLKG